MSCRFRQRRPTCLTLCRTSGNSPDRAGTRMIMDGRVCGFCRTLGQNVCDRIRAMGLCHVPGGAFQIPAKPNNRCTNARHASTNLGDHVSSGKQAPHDHAMSSGRGFGLRRWLANERWRRLRRFRQEFMLARSPGVAMWCCSLKVEMSCCSLEVGDPMCFCF